MAIFTGWWAFGTAVTNTGSFTEATTYTRQAVNFTGSAVPGLTQTIAQFTAPTGPVGSVINKAAIFDALTGGNCLCYCDMPTAQWLTITGSGNLLISAGWIVNVVFNTYLQAALSLSSTGGEASSGSVVDAGAQIGTVGGAPLIAATSLGIQSGALLRQAGGISGRQNIGSGLQWQAAGVNVGTLDSSGNLKVTGAATSTNLTLTGTSPATLTVSAVDLLIKVGGTSVASLGTAGNLVLLGTVTSSGTPA